MSYVQLQNSYPGNELNNCCTLIFFPPNSSDDLCLFFCIFPSSINLGDPTVPLLQLHGHGQGAGSQGGDAGRDQGTVQYTMCILWLFLEHQTAEEVVRGPNPT